MSVRERVHALRRLIVRNLPILLLAFAVVVVSVLSQLGGHDWGDDFALYLRQSKAIVEGNVGEVLAMNRYTSLESSFAPGPYAAPWGYPILLAPVMTVFGLDYPMLKGVGVLALAGSVILLYALVARRTSRVGAFAISAFIGLNYWYVKSTDQLLSELPFLFFVLLTLWWIDRFGEDDTWGEGSDRTLILTGLLVGFAFSIRREGMVLVIVVLAAQAAYLLRRRRSGGSSGIPWRRLALPHLSAAGLVIGIQLVLGGVILQGRDDTGIQHIVDNIRLFGHFVAEHLGIKHAGVSTWSVLGSVALAQLLFTVFVVFFLFGLVERVVVHGRQDFTWAIYVVLTTALVALLPEQTTRDLFPLTPFAVYFTYQGFVSTGKDIFAGTSSKVARIAPTVAAILLLLTFFTLHIPSHRGRISFALEYGDTRAEWGPEAPVSREMIAAVRARTRGDDVIGFMRARAMNLYVERQSVIVTRLDHVLARTDWYVMQKDSTYSQVLLTPEEAAAAGLTLVWENNYFVLWKVPPREF